MAGCEAGGPVALAAPAVRAARAAVPAARAATVRMEVMADGKAVRAGQRAGEEEAAAPARRVARQEAAGGAGNPSRG